MVRFGVIGTNWITEQFIEALKEVEGSEVVAVYSRTKETAAAFSAKFSIPDIYTDLTEMATSANVDAVYIASPNAFHAEQAILCMNHGKHVLCEKPIASNATETQAMIAVAEENKVLLMEALKTTFFPNFQAIREALPKIGRIRRYVGGYCQYSSRYAAYLQGTVLNAFNPAFSNGALMDLGIYCLHPLVSLFGKPAALKANAVLLDSGADGEGSILLDYGEKDAIIFYSKITDSSLPSEIQGEKGNIVIDKINLPQHVAIHYRDGTVEDISRPQLENEMYYEVEEFVALIATGKTESTINTYANSLIVSEIMEAARKQTGIVFPADKKSEKIAST